MRTQRIFVVLILIFLSAVIAIARLHTLHEPLERDITLYSVISHEMLGGRNLYSDLWEHKPPAVFMTFGAAELIAGYGAHAIYWLGVVSAIVTMLGLFVAGRAWTRKRMGGLWAATFWTLIASDLSLQANQPNTEVFLNACVVWAFAILAQGSNQPLGRWRALAVGVLFGWASLYKQVILADAVLLLSCHALIPPANQNRRRALFEVGWAFLAIGVVWMVVGGYFLAVGRWKPFFDTVFLFNQYYAGNMVANLVLGLRPTTLYPPAMHNVAVLCLLAVLGTALLLTKARKRFSTLLGGLIMGTYLGVASPGHFFPHYYQLWMPVIIIASAWGLQCLGQMTGKSWKVLAHVLAAGTMVWLLIVELPTFQLTADEWSKQKYGDRFILTKKMAEELKTLLHPGETFYQWGEETGLYYYSRQKPLSGVLHVPGLLGGPMADELLDRLLADLTRTPPDLLLFDPNYVRIEGNRTLVRLDPKFTAWFYPRYRLAAARPLRNDFMLFVRQGSELERRITPIARDDPTSGNQN